MTQGVDNPAVDLNEVASMQYGRDDWYLSTSDHSQPSIVTAADKGCTDIRQCSLEEDMRATSHNGLTFSKWRGNIVGAVTARPGVILALLSAFFYSGKGILLEIVSKRINAFQTVVIIMPMMLIASSLGIAITHAPPPKRKTHYLWLLLNGMTSSLALTTFTLAITYMDVADVVAISYSSLIFVGFLGWVILKEPLGIFDFVFSFIALAGVVFIARPYPLFGQLGQDSEENSENYLIGIGCSLGTAVGVALGVISFRKQTQLEINKFVSIFACACVVTLSNIVICATVNQWRVPYLYEWIYALGTGLCYFAAQLCCIMSLKLETPTMVSIILTFEIACSFLWQFLILGISPAWTSYVGSLLLIFASVGITLYKNRSKQPSSIQETKREDALNDSIERKGRWPESQRSNGYQ